ncbi:type VI secretion system baseplate subunit TssG [Chitinophagaceae bacterium MMS25-I14]
MVTEQVNIAGAHINRIDTDYKAEVVAASLMHYHYNADAIFMKRIGLGRRSRSKDINRLRQDYYDLDNHRLVIETNREGIYDYMPEGVFHAPTLGGIGKNTDEIIEQIRQQKKAEDDARRFFIPFELEAYYTTLSAVYFENSLDHKETNDELLEILKELWPILDHLDAENARTFVHLLPFFHAARGSRYWIEKCMTAFLKYPVNITDQHNKVEEEISGNMLLSDTRLGIDTLLCGSHYDGTINWQINIGPLPAADIRKFVPGSSFNRLLGALYDYCLPAHVTAMQHCITEAGTASFTLDTEMSENHLGYTTFL